MKRLGFLFTMAVLTFGVGVAVSSSHAWIRGTLTTPKIEPVNKSQKEPGADEVKIRLHQVIRDNDWLMATFRVTNGSKQTLSYWGYNADSNVAYVVKQGSRSQRFSPSCGTGLDEYHLEPGESATFSVPLSDAGYVQVGFEFVIDQQKLLTIWGDEVFIPAF